MKKVLLSLLGVGVGLMLLGVVFLAAGGFRPVNALEPYFTVHPRGSGTAARYDTPRTVRRELDAAAVRSITLSLVNADVQVEKGEGRTVTLSYEEAYQGEWDYAFSGSALTLRYRKYAQNWLAGLLDGINSGGDGLDGDKITVHLTVPAGSAPALSVTDVNGSCSASGVVLQGLTVKGVNTQISLSAVRAADTLAVHATNGDAQITGSSAPTLNIDAMVNAGCTVTSSAFDRISASGQVNNSLVIEGLKNPADYSLSYHTVNGGVTYNGVSYTGNGVLSGGSAGTGKKSIDYQGVNSSLKVTFD